MHKPNLIVRWAALVAFILILFVMGCGGHTTAVTPTPTTATPQTILFTSSRALDGSDAGNINGTQNLWIVNEDGTEAKPLTQLTASLADVTDAVWSPDGSKIAFVSGRALDGSDAKGGNVNIWVMNADGTGATSLTKLTVAASLYPAWSPDGTKIAFQSDAALDGSDSTIAVGNLWVMNADGSGRTPVTTLSSVKSLYASWSPNGKSIAFLSSRALDGSDSDQTTINIWTVKPDGTAVAPLTKLTAQATHIWNPAPWSPDGTKIAYASDRALNGSDSFGFFNNIWVVSADGTSTTPLTEFALYENPGSLAWSPDGTKIAYTSQRPVSGNSFPGPSNIFVMHADGFGIEPLTRLTAANAMSSRPAWSPDSQKIVFDSRRALDGSDAINSTTNVWIMNADGTGARPLTRLTNKDAYNGDPQFRP